VDLGILYDGIDFGLTYVTRRARYNRAADLILDVNEGHLLPPFSPVDDDLGQANRVTVELGGGGAGVTVEDTDGDLGTVAIGPIDQTVQANIASLAGAVNHAGFRVRLGTVVGYRYPELHFSLAKCPELIAEWVAMRLGFRIDVNNLLDARSQLPSARQLFALQGYTQTISQRVWDVVANVTPYEPWMVAEVVGDDRVHGFYPGTPPGATTFPGAGATVDEFWSRADTSGATLDSAMSVGASSISVTTATGALWTTDATEYPFALDIGGIQVIATACVDGTSPQTISVDATTTTTAKAAGTRVQLWQPAYVAL
jgi:hypothetical protein